MNLKQLTRLAHDFREEQGDADGLTIIVSPETFKRACVDRGGTLVHSSFTVNGVLILWSPGLSGAATVRGYV